MNQDTDHTAAEPEVAAAEQTPAEIDTAVAAEPVEPASEPAPEPAEAPAAENEPAGLSADLRELVDQEVGVAKDAAKAEIDTAVAACQKMLQIAAGDTDQVLTDAEAAAVQLVAHNAGPYAGSVLGFASSVLGNTVNPIVEDGVKKALAYAGTWLALLATNIEKGL